MARCSCSQRSLGFAFKRDLPTGGSNFCRVELSQRGAGFKGMSPFHVVIFPDYFPERPVIPVLMGKGQGSPAPHFHAPLPEEWREENVSPSCFENNNLQCLFTSSIVFF